MEIIPAYSCDSVVRCLTRHYEILVLMGYLDESEIQHAPPGGWDESQIDAEFLRTMGRNETVINLLRHIPYLKHDREVLPETKPITYLGQKWATTDKLAKSKSLSDFYDLMPFDRGPDPEPGMICLTNGRCGIWWLIDTAEGYIYPCGTHWEVHRAEGDPPWLWYRAVGIEKYFDGIYRQFLSLALIPMPGVIHHRKRGPPNELEHQIFNAGEQEVVLVKRIFHDHGWPIFEIFRKEECIKLANRARLQVIEKRTLRWRKEDVEAAEKCGDIEEIKTNKQREKEAHIEYNYEWE